MPQSSTINRRIVLHARPAGMPTAGDFRLDRDAVPVASDGQVLLRTLLLSLDPYQRDRMGEGLCCVAAVALGEVMPGATVSRVDASLHHDFRVGDLVLGRTGWQDYRVSNGDGLTTLVHEQSNPSRVLGVLGLPGYTAYRGLLDIGHPCAGETVVVDAAGGAVGCLVGQIARLKECRVVGLAGAEDERRYLVDELGFDRCVDPAGDGLSGRLAGACPGGIDVYFANVGGAVFDAVLPLLNPRARIPLCGLAPAGDTAAQAACPDRLGPLMDTLLRKRIRLQGFDATDDDGRRWREFGGVMGLWVQDGLVRLREDIVFGLQNAPEAFIAMLRGRRFGKLLIRLADE